jgi:threonine dehydratase
MRTAVFDISDIRAAAARLRGVAHRTPVMTSTALDDLAGAGVYVKCENLQRVGAFKFRGAYNALLLGIDATIVMPADASRVKLAATAGYGARIVTYDQAVENREAIAANLVASSGATLIPPYDHLDIIAGQGTAALELCEEVTALDAMLVPLGGGGLLAGSATAVKGVALDCAVYGIEPDAGDDWHRSWLRGERVAIDPPDTIAEGVRTTEPGAVTWPIVRANASGVLLVSDDEIRAAMRFAAQRMKIVVEPAGATVLAAVMARRLPIEAKRIGIIISGGNVDLETFAALCATGG